jgi:pimeloyl-ACP methyl ester carboxylesterase
VAAGPHELDVVDGERRIRVRVAGDPDGCAVVFFHGTPSSRLDLAAGESEGARRGVRLVAFDRPGYGCSTPGAFGLTSVARDVEVVVDRLGIHRFAAFGQSAGGRYALATAAALGDRVACVGCASGHGPVGAVPGSLENLDEPDKAAYALLPDDPVGAATVFAAGFEPLVRLVAEADDDEVVAAFEPMLAPADVALLTDREIRAAAAANVRESLRQGAEGAGWDIVTWISPWDFDVGDVCCPVLLWYGEQDTTPLANATWLRDNLPAADLMLWPGEGHLAYKSHLGEIFDALIARSC